MYLVSGVRVFYLLSSIYAVAARRVVTQNTLFSKRIQAYSTNVSSHIFFHVHIHPKLYTFFTTCPACRRYLRIEVAQQNGFEPIYIRLTCRPSTLEIRNISTAPKRNHVGRQIKAIYYWYNTRFFWTYHVRLATLLIFLNRVHPKYSHFPVFYSFKP